LIRFDKNNNTQQNLIDYPLTKRLHSIADFLENTFLFKLYGQRQQLKHDRFVLFFHAKNNKTYKSTKHSKNPPKSPKIAKQHIISNQCNLKMTNNHWLKSKKLFLMNDYCTPHAYRVKKI